MNFLFSYKLWLLSLLLMGTFLLHGQYATINGTTGASPNFPDYSAQMNGLTKDNYLRLNPDVGLFVPTLDNWTLKVRVLGNFVNQQTGTIVDPQFTALRFNHVNYGLEPNIQTPVYLGSSETTLISGADPIYVHYIFIYYNYDFIIDGGNHLLVPDGVYRANVEFLLYDDNQLIDSTIEYFQFEISTGTSDWNTFSLELQNNANFIDFQFNNSNAYANGLSVSKFDGLKVNVERGFLSSTNPDYQIMVHTQTSALTSATSASSIPVSAFRLKASGEPTAVVQNQIILGPNDQVLIENQSSVNWLGTAEHIYDLEYAVPTNETSNLLKPPGTYTTQVYFILIPQ